MSSDDELIKMSDGAGGEAMQAFLKESIIKHLLIDSNAEVDLRHLDDSCVVDDIVFTIDSHTVKPLFFPGGDIGSLSVAGTVNDISVMGARPVALALGMVIREGYPRNDLERIVASVGETSKACGVPVLTGDTKVVDMPSLDGVIVTTAGIGIHSEALEHNNNVAAEHQEIGSRWLIDSNVRAGDKIILTGHIGDHGIALMSVREGLAFDVPLVSDVKPLNGMIESALKVGGLVACKDPTRGGLANTLNEWADKSGVGIEVSEKDIPIRPSVQAACEMLGLNPFEIGNEGKAVIAVVPEMADKVLEAIRGTEEGKDAAVIGEAKEDIDGVVLRTLIGSRRVLEPPIGDPIPRIC
jgi:hydrogenase expression/formation protein HypE